ncbi:hypothetical protein KC950_00500 [Candidatus Saccharibacteria bacterium]|nr:hypothetical protein [Candidatus Saccharibacteria bacterium]
MEGEKNLYNPETYPGKVTPKRGSAGPGFPDNDAYNERMQQFAEKNRIKLPSTEDITPHIEDTISDLREGGVDDPYGAVEDE